MQPTRPTTFDFNKEILFGECGAFIAANITARIVSSSTTNTSIISISAVVGTLLGGALFWLGARVYDRIKSDKIQKMQFHTQEVASDIAYFTPAAIILGFIVYDPIIYLISHYFLNRGDEVNLSVIVGQVIAFSAFLICMNIYRIVLKRRGKYL